MTPSESEIGALANALASPGRTRREAGAKKSNGLRCRPASAAWQTPPCCAESCPIGH